MLGMEGMVCQSAWPAYDPALCVDDRVELAVQINGKVRSRVTVPAQATAQCLQEAALADAKVQEVIAGKTVRKVIAVPGKIINIVVG